MSDDDEISPGGSRVYRHEARDRDWEAPPSDGAMEAIEAHFHQYFGEVSSVFHELVSDLVHLDVHIVPPTDERPWYTLFTTGMSDRPMTVPEGCEELRYAELLIALPPDWRLDLLGVSPPPPDLERWYWPIRWLKQLARLPHEYGTWLGFGHSIPNGDPAEPFHPSTKLAGWVLLPPISVPEEGSEIVLPDRSIHLYTLHALHPEEMSLKLNKGTEALLDAFEAHAVDEMLRIDRPPVTTDWLYPVD
ncbi:MAG: suppressor of fused domain protein [Myxococcales bacterium]|nr:suppressor of fused domain protein [Myxococcales bacterium]